MHRVRASAALLMLSVGTTAVGVWLAYQFELLLLETTGPIAWALLVGFVEEAFVRFVPLILTFYLWSYYRGKLLAKAEGLLATVVSGMSVAGLEVVLKLDYLTRLETAARFDSLLLPILFVHVPFALLAGRFAYALGERIHGSDAIGAPSLSRETARMLLVGYAFLALAHVAYNVLV